LGENDCDDCDAAAAAAATTGAFLARAATRRQ
jgi:hypothetical protein